MIAVIFIAFPLPWTGDNLQWMTLCLGDPVVDPVMPDISIACLVRGRPSTVARFSLRNDAVDPGSRMALASAALPVNDEITILHVIRSRP